MPLQIGSRIGSYEVVSAIGVGGMGEVYRARDTKLGRDVAIKILSAAFADDPERLARFQREAQVLASINHPNIAGIYGLEEQSGLEALVLELVEGPTLADQIAQGPIPVDDALSIARQITDALEAAHTQGIIHRDLKPANIKLKPRGAPPPRAEDGGLERRLSAADIADCTVKVLDFGLAKLADPVGTASGSKASVMSLAPTITTPAMMTQAGVILGTAAYMSPEQAKGRPADQRSDVWAFGCVLYEMLTGARAFPGEDFSETFAAVIKSEPDWTALPANTPLAIRRLLRRCLQKDPKRRLQTAGDARLEIDDAASEPDQPASVPSQPAPAPKSGMREVVAWAIAGLALAGGAGVAWLHLRETPAAKEPLHLSIALPADAEVRALALSPDGRSVVMAAQIDDKYQLWIRRLDDPEFRPLAGTNLARVPFWSADSRSIGFFADGKLKTVSATGGPTRALCDSGPGSGGTWNRDGTILYARSEPGPIFQVPASGGECKPLTKPEPDSQHAFPEFLPDGRHFFYVVLRGDEAKQGVYVASLDNPNGARVLADRSSVGYIPSPNSKGPGSLIFLRGDTLMAQAFDASALQAIGDPTAVASHASRSNTAPQMAASTAPNGTLMFIANSESGQNRQLVWVDRSGKELEKVGAATEQVSAIAVSPGGNSAALSIPPNNGSGLISLWLRDLDRQTVSRLTAPTHLSQAPVWSPDGKRIVFSGVRPGSPVNDLYWKDVGSAEEHPLLKNSTYKAPSDWSRDGRYLVYTQTDPKTAADIWVLPNPAGASGADQKPFPFAATQFLETQGQFSPDGHWLAYVSDESGQYEVYVRPFPSGDGKWRVSGAGGSEPRWRGDGKELFYREGTLGKLRIMAVPVTPGTSSPGAPPKFGSQMQIAEYRTITALPQINAFTYAPSLDGQRFLLHRLATDVQPTLDVLLNWQRRTGS